MEKGRKSVLFSLMTNDLAKARRRQKSRKSGEKVYNKRAARENVYVYPYVRTVKVDGAGSVSVDLGDDAIEVGVIELVVEGCQDLLEGRGGDVAVALSVVEPEGLLELLLHGLGVLLLEEAAGDLAEAVEVDLSRSLRVILLDYGVELGVVEQLAHRVQDRRDLERVDEAALGRVEHLERLAHHRHLLLVFLLMVIVKQDDFCPVSWSRRARHV